MSETWQGAAILLVQVLGIATIACAVFEFVMWRLFGKEKKK